MEPSHRGLALLPTALREVGRDDLAETLLSNVHASNTEDLPCAPMGSMERAALVNKSKQFDEVALRNDISAFILTGHVREWPGALAHKLSFDIDLRIYSKPELLPLPTVSDNPLLDLCKKLAHTGLLQLKDRQSLSDADLPKRIGESLSKLSQPVTFYTTIYEANPMTPAQVGAYISAWEDTFRHRHRLLFVVEDVDQTKHRSPEMSGLFARLLPRKSRKPQRFLERYLADLEREKELASRRLSELDSPRAADVSLWVDLYLHGWRSLRTTEDVRTKAMALFQPGTDAIPHRTLALKLSKFLDEERTEFSGA
jgi:hypothetical protein